MTFHLEFSRVANAGRRLTILSNAMGILVTVLVNSDGIRPYLGLSLFLRTGRKQTFLHKNGISFFPTIKQNLDVLHIYCPALTRQDACPKVIFSKAPCHYSLTAPAFLNNMRSEGAFLTR